MMKNESNNPIAIVGIGCRLPGGASSAPKFWDMLMNKTDAIVEIPRERWDNRRFCSQSDQAHNKIRSFHGGFLREKIDEFDPFFFGISPREAETLDPQQRLLLEVSYEAMEDAGITLPQVKGSNTGVFVGGFTYDFGLLQLEKDNRALINSTTATGIMLTMLSNKLSYWYDFKGPSFTIDTACSSSLVATHVACQNIWAGECDMAMVGGVNVVLKPVMSMVMSAGKFLSKHGRCKAFDEEAAGYVRGEGAGVVLLKPYDKAVADGNKIYALIRATGINQDGKTGGITVPNGLSQKALIRKVLHKSGIHVNQVHYVEAHGTGTQAGDPVEFNAINDILKEEGYSNGKCLIGSVKTNIGHLEAGSGVAGLIKATLCLQHKTAPPNLHFNKPNPGLNYEESLLRIPVQPEPLPAGEPSFALVNSFGYGGTNAHVVLEEYRMPAADSTTTATAATAAPMIFPLSAHDTGALKQLAQSYLALLERNEVSAADLLYSAAHRRTHHKHRLAVVAQRKEDLKEKLLAFHHNNLGKQIVTNTAGTEKGKTVFVYTGMGPQWWKMGRELMAYEPVFRQSLEDCDAIFRRIASWSVLEEMQKDEATSRIKETQVAQPANFFIQVALTALLAHFGVKPDAVVGHSVGEVASAYISGALSLEEAILVSYHRSRLQQLIAGKGRMLAVSIPAATAENMIAQYPDISIAAINSPDSVTLSGDETGLLALADQFELKGIFCRMLEVEVPYHSPLMNEIHEELLESLRGLQPATTHIPLYSTVTGNLIEGTAIDAHYWWLNVRNPVSFAPAIDVLSANEFDCFMEIGPHPVLKTAITECLQARSRKGTLVHFMNRKEREQLHFYNGLATLYTLGHSVNWELLAPRAAFVPLPVYPWQKVRYWNESGISAEDRSGLEGNVFLYNRLPAAQPMYEVELNTLFFPFLRDHIVHGKIIFPGAGYITAAMAMYSNEPGNAGKGMILEDIAFHQLLLIDDRQVQLLHATMDTSLGQFRVLSRQEGTLPGWQLRATGRYVNGNLPVTGKQLDLPHLRSRCTEHLTAAALYDKLAHIKLEYGPLFRCVKEVAYAPGMALAAIEGHPSYAANREEYFIHPVLLDACFQVMVVASPREVVPVSIRRLNCYHAVGNRFLCYATITSVTPTEVEGDLTICLEDGAVAMHIEGLKCQQMLKLADADEEPGVADDFYLPEWQEYVLPATKQDMPAPVVVLAADKSMGLSAATALSARGVAVSLLCQGNTGRKVSGSQYELDFSNDADMKWALEAAGSSGMQVMYIPGKQEAIPDAERCLQEVTPLLQLMKNWPATGTRSLYIVTQQAHVIGDDNATVNLAAAPVWGLGGVIANEYPQCRVQLIDLPAQHTDWSLLAAVVGQEGSETEMAIRGTQLYVRRLRRKAVAAPETLKEAVNVSQHPVALKMGQKTAPGVPAFEEVSRGVPGNKEIEILVYNTAINNKDYPRIVNKGMNGHHYQVGIECAGVVMSLGKDVIGFRIGDHVIGICPSGAVRSYAMLPDHLTIQLPAGIPHSGAAALIPFVGALHALKYIAQLGAGDKILIPRATESAGMAAIQYARMVGAEIFATAEGAQQQDLLRNAGVQHVFGADDIDAIAAILGITNGYGIDVVFSMSHGEMLYQGLALLAPYGKYLDVSGDQSVQKVLPMQHFSRNLTFASVDAERIINERPLLAAKYLKETREYMEAGHFTALQVKEIAAWEIGNVEARTAEQSWSADKTVIRFYNEEVEIPVAENTRLTLKPDATYLVTGGTRGLGLAIARWMVARGVRNVVLVSRSGAQLQSSQDAIREMEAAGAVVWVVVADIADGKAVQALITKIQAQLPPLKGIFHGAMVLDDGFFADMTPDRFRKVMTPKIDGAVHLHNATATDTLDFFVCISSVSTLISNPGQANYIAANGFLDAFAHYRRQKGWPATTINLGVVAGTGVVARDEKLQAMLEDAGIHGLSTREIMEGITIILKEKPIQTGFFSVDWETWASGNPVAGQFSLFKDLVAKNRQDTGPVQQQQEVVAALMGMSREEWAGYIGGLLVTELSQILKMDAGKIDRDKGINLLGIDSVMVVELIGAVKRNLGIVMLPMEFLTGPSVTVLAEVMLKRLPLPAEEMVSE
ncbi:type I polyketide synthase [Chitinophaga polysaccharea]|nr:type I polyketide synthase [Chitinophaga polysaccharea]